MGWLYVPDMEDSSLRSDLCSETISALSVTWRGITYRLEYLQRAWRTKPSIRRLSGMTLQPSTATAGVERWISSQQDSPASRLVLRVSDSAPPMSDGFGRISPELFARFDRGSCSWKTYPDLFGTVSDVLPEIWPKAGSLRNGTVSQLPRSARRTNASGFSFWHTPRAIYGDGHAGMESETHLTGQAISHWPTPDASAMRRYNTSPGPAGPRPTLALSVENWSTPLGREWKDTAGANVPENGILAREVFNDWATPRAEDSERTGAHRGTPDTLTSQLDHWQTPRSEDIYPAEKYPGVDHEANQRWMDEPPPIPSGEYWQTPATDSFRSRGGDRKNEQGLDQQSRFWATPVSSPQQNRTTKRQPSKQSGAAGFENLATQATESEQHSHQGETTQRGGARTSAPVVLNPRFVEALMGLPEGMTDYSAPVTELCQWSRRMRSLLWQLA